MKARAGKMSRRRASFRLRMIAFSVLVSGIGLLGFALLALGFLERELRRNLERDLSGALVQSAPILLRSTEGNWKRVENWMAARIEGRLDQFGAEYAVRRFGRPGWILSSDWPEPNEEVLDRVARRLPETAFPPNWQGLPRQSEERFGQGAASRFRDGRPTPRMIRNVRVFRSPDWPGDWLVAGLRNDDAVILLAVPKDLNRGESNRLVSVFLIAGPLALLLVGLGAYLLAGRALAPIRRLTEVAGSITATDLSQRIGDAGMEREFSRLIKVFNGMLDRLERSFQQARRFGQDAAHELNTPLTILTARIDEALDKAPAGSEDQVRLAAIGEELGRMKEIVKKLELLARIDGGGFHPAKESFDIRSCCDNALTEVSEMYPEIRFRLSEGPEHKVCADPGLTRQILLNLLRNGARYNRENGEVAVDIRIENGTVCLTVTNTGPAIPGELAPRIFDRFTRGDIARTPGDGGLGLGLSLAREFARAMEGDLKLTGTDEDAITFELILPVAGRENADDPGVVSAEGPTI